MDVSDSPLSAAPDYDVDLGMLEGRRLLSFYDDILRSLRATRVVQIRRQISHVADFTLTDSAQDLRRECWLLLPLETETTRNSLNALLHPQEGSVRQAALGLMGPAGVAEILPEDASLVVVLADRHSHSPVVPESIATLVRSADVPVKFWGADTLERLARRDGAILARYFDPLTVRLQNELKARESDNATLKAKNDELKRLETERQWLARKNIQLERDAIWKELSERIAHKFGNPLTTIGMAERNIGAIFRSYILPKLPAELDNEISDSKLLLERSLGNLRTAVTRAANILNEFKTYARAQGITLEEKKHTDVLTMIEGLLKENDISYSINDTDTSNESTLLIDPDKLQQSLDEIISNANTITKAECSKSVSIRVSCKILKNIKKLRQNLDDGRSYIDFIIEDDGPGIEKAKKDWIFFPFSTSRKDNSGSGQGLAIVRRIIEGHGGDIWEDGKYGEGARFHICLPLETITSEIEEVKKHV